MASITSINLEVRESRFRVLGVSVDAVQIPDVIELMEHWIAARSACHFIAFTGMHGITEAQYDPSFKQILNSADLVVADGMPLVWLGRWHGLRTCAGAFMDRNSWRPSAVRPGRCYQTLFLRRRAGCCGSPGGEFEATVRSAHRRNLLSTLSAADRGRKGGSGPPNPGGGAGCRLGRPEHAQTGALDVRAPPG